MAPEVNGEVRFRSLVNLVRIRDPKGKLKDFYDKGRILPDWAAHDDDQVRRFLDHGLIELVDAGGTPPDPGRVVECLSALISCGVPLGAGRPRAAAILRGEGMRYSNETVSKALKLFNSDWKLGEPIEEFL